jgi:signal recognition particle receptor subunit beta
MVQFNFSERTIKAKVVYYGPAQSGKTTNLEQIHRLTDPLQTNRLISLNTAQDRTLFFDLLPFSLGTVAGYDFKVQLYTIPGQVQYNATRRVVLAGADAVVFVADGRKSMLKENVAAFENMKVNLLANRLVPEKVPLALQYNKQDLPDLTPRAELDKAINPWGRRAFPAVAAQGEGVLETFVAIVQDMLQAIAMKYNLKEKGLDPAAVPQIVSEAFDGLLRQAREAASSLPAPEPEPPMRGPSPFAPNAPAPERLFGGAAGSPYAPNAPAAVPGKVILSQATDSLHAAPVQATAEGLVSEELLHRSIRSNVEMAEALANLAREVNLGLGMIFTQAQSLAALPPGAEDERTAAVLAIQRETARLRRVVETLGQIAAAAAPSAAPRPAPPPAPLPTYASQRIAPVSMPPPAPPAAPPAAPPPAAARPSVAAPPFGGDGPSAPSPPRPSPPPTLPPIVTPRTVTPAAARVSPTGGGLPSTSATGHGFDSVMSEVIASLRPTLDACGVAVDLWVPSGTLLPRCPPQHLRRALAGMLEGIATGATGPSVSVRCEKKPVVLRSRDGEVKRDFLMVVFTQGRSFTSDEQQRILQGTEPGALGQAVRLIREMGGFVRFAPGAEEGALETKVFLPAG